MNAACAINYQNQVVDLLVSDFNMPQDEAKGLMESHSEKVCGDWAVGWKTPDMSANMLMNTLNKPTH